MYTINKNIENTINIKNSRFITLLYYVDNIKDITKLLHETKEKHQEANHICYAYRLENTSKCSDDGEPKKTAGMPMLSILEKNNLINTLVIVIRYFGGVKLGANGLIRAYGTSVKEALDLIEKKVIKEMILVEFSFNYEIQSNIDYLLKEAEIIKKKFTERITYTAVLNNKLFESLSNYKINIITKTTIKKRV